MKINKRVLSLVVFSVFCFGMLGSSFADLNDGLIAYYPFDGNANDESGNGNHGTVYGSPQIVQGVSGKAMQFDGIQDWIKIENTSDFKLISWTVSSWIKVNEFNEVSFIGKNDDANAKYNFTLLIDSSRYVRSQYETCNNEGDHYLGLNNSQALLSTNQWYFVTSTRDAASGEHALWINGTKIDSGIWNDTPCTNGEYLTIAHQLYGAATFFKGTIDNIRIYNRALSASEIEQIYLEDTNKLPVINKYTANPKSGVPPLTVAFKCTAKDTDGTIAEYQWDFGDGEDNTTTKGITSHTYTNAGEFTAKVTVVDNDGGSASKTIVINPGYGADLVGKMEQFTFDEVNHKVKMTLRVTNGGTSLATPFSISYHLSNDGTTPLLPEFKVVRANSGLKPGRSIAPLVDVKFNESIYGKYILIFVDSRKEVPEIDETNNGVRLVIQPMVTQ